MFHPTDSRLLTKSAKNTLQNLKNTLEKNEITLALIKYLILPQALETVPSLDTRCVVRKQRRERYPERSRTSRKQIN